MSGRSAAPGSAPLHSAPAAARLALRSGRLGSAQLCAPQRRRAGPAAALRSLAPRRAAQLPPARPPARRPPALRRSQPRSRPPRPAGRPSARPFGLRSRSGRWPGPVPGQLRSGSAPAAPGVPARAGHLAPGGATGAGRRRGALLSAPLASASRSHRCGGRRAARPLGSRWPCPLSLSPSSAVQRTP